MNSVEERNEALKKIKEEIVSLESSPLFRYRQENRYFPVIGEGDHFAKIMFIGEAPGENEAKTGRPFCGRAGKVLDSLLNAHGIKREAVYVTNIVKDRPPGNRDPFPEEIKAYASFLDRQIKVIQPEIIATLGRFSMEYVMNRYGLSDQLSSISVIHGRVFETLVNEKVTKVIPLYHPAAAIYNQSLLKVLESDFKALSTIQT